MGSARKLMTRMAVVGLTMVAGLAIASPAKAADPYQVENYYSKQCLAIGGASVNSGAAAIQWSCRGGDEQKWEFDYLGHNDGAPVYQLHNAHSGKCLAIGGASTANGAGAIQWPCGNGSEQYWKNDSQQRLRNMNSGLCLAIPNASTTTGIQAIQWTCKDGNSNREQMWLRIVPQGD